MSSTQISKQINVDASQIAKDLSYVNISGRTRVGYEIDALIEVLERFLGFTKMHKAFLFGVGSLGGALLRDSGLHHFGLEIVGAFDINPGRCLWFVITVFTNHPIIIISMRMSAIITSIDSGAMSHPATLETLERRQSREVDIQTGIFRQSLLQHHLNNLQYPIAQRSEISIFIIIATAEGYAWNTLPGSVHVRLICFR